MQSFVQNCARELKRTSASCLEKKMEKIMENTILHSHFKNFVTKSLYCVYCALIIKIILNYYYGLLIKTYKRFAGNYLKYLSPSKGVVCGGTLVQWYTGTMVHWDNGTLVQWYTGIMSHWYTGTMNIVCLHYCSCSIAHLANTVCLNYVKNY